MLTNIGQTKDEEDVSGTITIPEVAHDTEEDEYVVCLLVPMGGLFGPTNCISLI
jgi:hypothetical protein